jgi:phosphomannomutase
VLLRLSGTEPLLRVYTEAATQEESTKIAEETKAWITSAAEEARA